MSTENIDKQDKDKTKKLPIINPLVRLPSWPSELLALANLIYVIKCNILL